VDTAPTPPAAPSDLTAVEQPGPQVSLAWADNSNNETGFAIERSEDGISFAPLSSVAADTTSYIDTTVSAGMTYTYQVNAFNDVGPSAFSNTASVTLSSPPTDPAAPSDLMAGQFVAGQVNLAWVDNASNETGFAIERSEDGITFTPLMSVGADTTSYVDTTVVAGVTYTYQVNAFNDVGPSAFSNTASVAVIDPPLAPDQLEANLEDIPAVDLVWADNALDETGFVIERSTDGVTFSVLTSLAADTTNYVDAAVLGGVTYTYRVAAVIGTVQSDYSNTASIFVPDFTTPPAAPSNLSVSNVTQNSLTLHWQDNANNETGFTIEIATKSNFTGNLITINVVGPNINFYDITGLNSRTKYYFRVRAYNPNFTSPWSPVLNVTTRR
jgi:titin